MMSGVHEFRLAFLSHSARGYRRVHAWRYWKRFGAFRLQEHLNVICTYLQIINANTFYKCISKYVMMYLPVKCQLQKGSSMLVRRFDHILHSSRTFPKHHPSIHFQQRLFSTGSQGVLEPHPNNFRRKADYTLNWWVVGHVSQGQSQGM